MKNNYPKYTLFLTAIPLGVITSKHGISFDNWEYYTLILCVFVPFAAAVMKYWDGDGEL